MNLMDGARAGAMQDKTRVMIVDDHAWVRKSVRLLLERQPDIVVVGTATDGLEVLDLVGMVKPDVIVMDIDMPGMNGIDAAARLRAMDARADTIILSLHISTTLVRDAIAKGAKGYVLKAQASTDLPEAIREVIQGRLYFSPLIPPEMRPSG